MREIKFRVWDKVEKEMILPAEWEEDYVGGGNKKIGLYIFRSKKDPRQHSSLDWVLRHPEYFDVMQATGLKDKNGKEIYEGDIISYGDCKGRHIKRIKWNEYRGYWMAVSSDHYKHFKDTGIIFFTMPDKDMCKRKVKIIGSIHTHPELIKK